MIITTNKVKKKYIFILTIILLISTILLFSIYKKDKAIVIFYEPIIFNYGDTTTPSSYSMDTYYAIKNGTAESEPRANNEIQFTGFIDFERSIFDAVSFASISHKGMDTGMHPKAIDTSKVGQNFKHTLYYSYKNNRYSVEFTYSVVDKT